MLTSSALRISKILAQLKSQGWFDYTSLLSGNIMKIAIKLSSVL